ncbi:uncharacterized protein LOC123501209 isoform X2 [Portunus trituberculatus]|uniref:uncharacterized protein LOC123501209 isoform X2 n=1 Tax=Portunus trituberculatus TaxID=210409 RepID=UPI001E1CB37F|nr:uncharacterized protein LOC123501209 isoform X2 [Portunus trituberculatus]
MANINKNLVLLKLLLFTFYGALGCVMVFLNIHMRFLGISMQEVTWINSALPLFALIGPPIVGMVADKLGHYRAITIICMLFAMFLHVGLLFVPSCNSTSAEDATLSLHCFSDKAVLEVESCLSTCSQPLPLMSNAFQVDNCWLVCDEQLTIREAGNMTSFQDKAGKAGRENISAQFFMLLQPTHGTPEYVPFDGEQVLFRFNESVMPEQVRNEKEKEEEEQEEEEEEKKEEDGSCHYPLQNFVYKSSRYTSLSCQTQEPHCQIVCNMTKQGNDTQLLDTSSCCQVTLWVYFSLRALAEMFSSILVSLLEAVALTMVHQHNGDYGREKMFGLLAVALFTPLSGFLVDSKVGTFGIYSYAPVFYVFGTLMLITLVTTFALPIQVKIQRRSLLKNMAQLVRTAELSVLLLIMTILGTFWGYLITFVYLYLEDLKASKLLIGLTTSFSILPSVPFLYRSGVVVKYCGHHYLIMLAFVGYCVRFAGLSYITNPWWVALIDTLELFTLNLLNVSAATLAYKLAPKTFVATAQALVWVSHYNIGRCIGTFVGGHLLVKYGHRRVFQGASVMAATCAAIYLGLHQLINYYKARRSAAPKPQPVRENGNVPNGRYTPLAVAEDERL